MTIVIITGKIYLGYKTENQEKKNNEEWVGKTIL